MQDPNVWSDQKNVSKLGGEIKEIKENLDSLKFWQRSIEDAETALDINDTELINESFNSINAVIKSVESFELRMMLSGEYDDADAILTINAGAGGTDAQDWASMLLRMYIRWAENRNWQVELLDKLDGEEAGIKSATIKITGKYSFGYAKAER